MRATLTAPVLSSLLDAVTLLRSTPREILLKRSPARLDETARPVLDRAAARAQAIVERHKELTKGFPSRSATVHQAIVNTQPHCARLASSVDSSLANSGGRTRSGGVFRKSRVKVHSREMAQEARSTRRAS